MHECVRLNYIILCLIKGFAERNILTPGKEYLQIELFRKNAVNSSAETDAVIRSCNLCFHKTKSS